jgi:putative transposase
MGELLIGLTKYFAFYNGERPHQALGNQTPDAVYQSGVGGGAVIVDKYPRAMGCEPVSLRSTGSQPIAGIMHEVMQESGQRCSAV